MLIDSCFESMFEFFREDFENEFSLKTIKDVKHMVEYLEYAVEPKTTKENISLNCTNSYYLLSKFLENSISSYEISEETENCLKMIHSKFKNLYSLWKEYYNSISKEPFKEWDLYKKIESIEEYNRFIENCESIKGFIEKIEYLFKDKPELIECLDTALIDLFLH